MTSTAPNTPDADGLQPLDPRVRTMWTWAAALSAAGPLVFAVIGAFVIPVYGVLGLAVVVVVAVLAIFVVPEVRYRRWRYALRDEELEIRQGVLWTTVTLIPYSRLQFVDTRQGPMDRYFGLTTLVVHTAAPGTSGALPGLSEQTAALLRERLSSADWIGDEPSV